MQIQKEYQQITSQANQKGNAYAKPNSCKTTQNMQVRHSMKARPIHTLTCVKGIYDKYLVQMGKNQSCRTMHVFIKKIAF